MKKIKIKNSCDSKCWYADKVGEVYEVGDNLLFMDEFYEVTDKKIIKQLAESFAFSPLYIFYKDVEEIKETR